MAETTDGETDHGRAVRLAAVAIINRSGPGAVTAGSIAAATGLTAEHVVREVGEAHDVFRAIFNSLEVALQGTISATTTRRRSLTESLAIALTSYWDSVEDRIDEHQAAKQILLYTMEHRDPALCGGSLYDSFISSIGQWLIRVQQVHDIDWEKPVRELAALLLAVLEGLSTNFAFTRDSALSRRLLTLFAFQLAQYGRRRAKNQLH